MTPDLLHYLHRELQPIPRPRKIERQWYETESPHGPFPAGTWCVVWRPRPDSYLVMEFEDGSVAEVSYGVTRMELDPSPLASMFGWLFGGQHTSRDDADSLLFARLVYAASRVLTP